MANGSVGSLDGLRRDLRSDQRQVLNAIWRYYADHNDWIPGRILHHNFGRAGKSFVRTAIDPPALGGDVVFMVGHQPEQQELIAIVESTKPAIVASPT